MSSPILKVNASENHEVAFDLIKAVVGIAITAYVGYWLWITLKDIFVVLYSTLCLVLILLRTYKWPRVSWLGSCKLSAISQTYANKRLQLSAKTATVAALASHA